LGLGWTSKIKKGSCRGGNCGRGATRRKGSCSKGGVWVGEKTKKGRMRTGEGENLGIPDNIVWEYQNSERTWTKLRDIHLYENPVGGSSVCKGSTVHKGEGSFLVILRGSWKGGRKIEN